MEPLTIPAGTDTPCISFNPVDSILSIEGKSYPEDTREFYEPVLTWLKNFSDTSPKNITAVFKLKYFNSSSYKPLFDIIQLLCNLKNQQTSVSIQWHYRDGDEDMKEAGEEFSDLCGMDFSYHPF